MKKKEQKSKKKRQGGFTNKNLERLTKGMNEGRKRERGREGRKRG